VKQILICFWKSKCENDDFYYDNVENVYFNKDLNKLTFLFVITSIWYC